MTSLLVSNMTKTDGGATRLEMKLIGPESCDDVRTWCTGAFWFKRIDVMILGKL